MSASPVFARSPAALWLLLGLTLLLPTGALAQNSEPSTWSVALGLGRTSFSANDRGIAREFPELQPGFDVDESAVGFRVVGSYRFDPMLSLDLELVELGDLIAEDANGRDKLFSVTGFVTAIRAQYPINERVHGFARLGAFLWASSVDVDDTVDDGLDVGLGLGADINLYGGFERVLRIEWDRYGFNGVTLDDASLLSVNIVFNF